MSDVADGAVATDTSDAWDADNRDAVQSPADVVDVADVPDVQPPSDAVAPQPRATSCLDFVPDGDGGIRPSDAITWIDLPTLDLPVTPPAGDAGLPPACTEPVLRAISPTGDHLTRRDCPPDGGACQPRYSLHLDAVTSIHFYNSYTYAAIDVCSGALGSLDSLRAALGTRRQVIAAAPGDYVVSFPSGIGEGSSVTFGTPRSNYYCENPLTLTNCTGVHGAGGAIAVCQGDDNGASPVGFAGAFQFDVPPGKIVAIAASGAHYTVGCSNNTSRGCTRQPHPPNAVVFPPWLGPSGLFFDQGAVMEIIGEDVVAAMESPSPNARCDGAARLDPGTVHGQHLGWGLPSAGRCGLHAGRTLYYVADAPPASRLLLRGWAGLAVTGDCGASECLASNDPDREGMITYANNGPAARRVIVSASSLDTTSGWATDLQLDSLALSDAAPNAQCTGALDLLPDREPIPQDARLGFDPLPECGNAHGLGTGVLYYRLHLAAGQTVDVTLEGAAHDTARFLVLKGCGVCALPLGIRQSSSSQNPPRTRVSNQSSTERVVLLAVAREGGWLDDAALRFSIHATTVPSP